MSKWATWERIHVETCAIGPDGDEERRALQVHVGHYSISCEAGATQNKFCFVCVCKVCASCFYGAVCSSIAEIKLPPSQPTITSFNLSSPQQHTQIKFLMFPFRRLHAREFASSVRQRLEF